MTQSTANEIGWSKGRLDGSCLCGGVRFTMDGLLRDVINCFCSQCRKTSGHYVAATAIRKEHLTLHSAETLAWYECLPGIRRGFCKQCGSSLFWDPGPGETMSVMAGTLEPPTGLRSVQNIHQEDASDYCAFPGLSGQ